MKKMAFVTYAGRPTISDNDMLVATILRAQGMEVSGAAWDDPAVDWAGFTAVILRACWNYHHNPPAFRAWLDRLEAVGVPVWNSLAVARWNMDKRYLRQMAEWGAAVLPTVWVEPTEEANLATILQAQGWGTAVVKPCISAGADGIWRVDGATAVAEQTRFAATVAQGPVMVQALQPQIADGEYSFIFLGGEFSHTVLKRPSSGDIFVQGHRGGSDALIPTPADYLAQASAILDIAVRHSPANGTPFLYARVDGLPINGQFHLMELEVLEPYLFLEAESAQKLADKITAVV